VVGLIVILAALAAVAVGCGSGDDAGVGESSTEETSASGTAGGAAQPSATAEKPKPSQRPQTQQPQARPGASGKSGASNSTDAQQTAKPTPAHRRALGRRAAKDCPAGLSAEQCGALVEAYGAARGANPTTLNGPGDCRQVMSQADCEAMLTAQKEAAEAAGTPLSVEECIQNPTPRCEETLRPMFEEQQAAGQ
jgi:hypothetical protein